MSHARHMSGVKTRTWFSAFDAWYRYLKDEGAIGTFDEWNHEVRNSLAVGDTIEFSAELVLSPLHKLLRTFLAFAESASQPGTIFTLKGAELAETKQTAQLMQSWMRGRGKSTHIPMYLRPGGVPEPRIVAGLLEPYIIGSPDSIEGRYTVVGQVTALLSGDQAESTIRLIRDVPPTQLEINTVSEALIHMIQPGRELGVEIDASDINIPAPAVLLRPIAIYQ
jgi:hypothetical protein